MAESLFLAKDGTEGEFDGEVTRDGGSDLVVVTTTTTTTAYEDGGSFVSGGRVGGQLPVIHEDDPEINEI